MPWLEKKPQVLNRVVAIPVRQIVPNPNQPRRDFDPSGIDMLARSIAANGLLQPISVRALEDGRYELISGERRLLAYQSLGQESIPAILLDIQTQDSAVLALVENLHRSDLSFFEEAQAIASLMDKLHLTQQQAARLLCKSQPAVANKLRLLRLPVQVRTIVRESGLTERHARALLRLENPKAMASAATHMARNGLNVAQAEAYIDRLLNHTTPKQGRVAIVRDVRLLFNSINRAVDVIKQSGFAVETQRMEDETYVNYVVRIPKETVYRATSNRDASATALFRF